MESKRVPWRKNILVLLGMAWFSLLVAFGASALATGDVGQALDLVSEPLTGLVTISATLANKLAD